jgi:serine/threonine protein kinase
LAGFCATRKKQSRRAPTLGKSFSFRDFLTRAKLGTVSSEVSGNGLDVTLREFVSGQKLFNRYRLVKTLGRGGMGVVWLAHDEELERNVALKFLPELIVHDRAVLSDLKRETKRSLELTHRNIVRIYDFIHDQVSGAISMEYVDGDTLSNLRADKALKVFAPEELADWMSQLCDALDYAHNHARIVHRDLKPANLMVNQRGDLKVADFGIARSLSDSVSKLTMQHGKSGTLVYMSPQQLEGERGTPLDDIYSIGASVYELLTSKPPFYSGNVDRQIREKLPPRMTDRRKELEIDGGPIDETWEKVVAECLSKDPVRRPQSVTEIAQRLEVPSPKTRRARQATPERSMRTGVVTAVAGLLCVVAIGGWYFGVHKPAKQPPLSSPASTIKTSQGFGGVMLATSPSGATVTLGGVDAGKSPVTFKGIRAGKYPLRISLDGYKPFEREVEIKGDKFVNLGTIALEHVGTRVDITSTPPGARIFEGGKWVGRTPFQGELPSGHATLLFTMDGYLPILVEAELAPKDSFKTQVTMAKPAPAYRGMIRAQGEPERTLTVRFRPDVSSGTMTYGSHHGDFVVKFSGVWEGPILHAVTGDVVTQPPGIRWTPESFTLRFGEGGRTGSYECKAEKKTYFANLTAR